MKTPSVTKRKSFLIVVCPECRSEKVDLTGEGGFSVFHNRAELVDMLVDTDGDTLSEKVAYSCSSKCGDAHHHRHCKERPCGYCKSKVAV